MTVTAMDITSLRGRILPLDSRIRDALATYARLAAEDEGLAPQAWCRKTWGLKDYAAKALLKGDASDAMWERICKSNHPRHGSWHVILPVMGAVVGQSISDFFREQARKAADENKQFEHHATLADAAWSRRSVGAGGPGMDRPQADRTTRRRA